jgi:hypothetical protein
MTILWELEMQKTSVFPDFYCLPNKLALMGLRPGLLSVVPTGLACDRFILLLVGKCRCETLRKGAHAALSNAAWQEIRVPRISCPGLWR